MKRRLVSQADTVIKVPGTLERRSSRRFKVSWDAAIKGADSTSPFDEEGKLENLSSTGAYLCISKPPRVGEQMELWIKLPLAKENWMKYPVEVVRVENRPTQAGVALKFHAVRPSFFKP